MNIDDATFDDDNAMWNIFCRQAGRRIPHFNEVAEKGVQTLRYLPNEGRSVEDIINDAISRYDKYERPIFIISPLFMTIVSKGDDAKKIASDLIRYLPASHVTVDTTGKLMVNMGSRPPDKKKKPF